MQNEYYCALDECFNPEWTLFALKNSVQQKHCRIRVCFVTEYRDAINANISVTGINE